MVLEIATELDFWTTQEKGIQSLEEKYMVPIAEAVSSGTDEQYLEAQDRLKGQWGRDHQSR